MRSCARFKTRRVGVSEVFSCPLSSGFAGERVRVRGLLSGCHLGGTRPGVVLAATLFTGGPLMKNLLPCPTFWFCYHPAPIGLAAERKPSQ